VRATYYPPGGSRPFAVPCRRVTTADGVTVYVDTPAGAVSGLVAVTLNPHDVEEIAREQSRVGEAVGPNDDEPDDRDATPIHQPELGGEGG
jgi:hypothetical protein